jgi:hypothetical protein
MRKTEQKESDCSLVPEFVLIACQGFVSSNGERNKKVRYDFHNSETSSVSIYAVPSLTLPFSMRITQQ